MDTKLNTIRLYRRGMFEVEIAAHIEFDHPAGTLYTGDAEADAEYVRKIETGEYPWYQLGVHVRFSGREIGTSYLGWCDTTDLYALGVRDMVATANAEARDFIDALKEGEV